MSGNNPSKPPLLAYSTISLLRQYGKRPARKSVIMTHSGPRILRRGKVHDLLGLLRGSPKRVVDAETAEGCFGLSMRGVAQFNRWWDGLSLSAAHEAIALIWRAAAFRNHTRVHGAGPRVRRRSDHQSPAVIQPDELPTVLHGETVDSIDDPFS